MDRFTEALVAIGSENPPGMAYRECRDCIAEELRRGALEPRISGEAIHAFVGPAGPTVYFHGHYDVVPAFTPDQFRPSVRDGRMIGRGTADMKAGLALMLYAARAVNECEIPLQGRIGLTFVPDEETGGERGSRMLADQGLLGREGIAMLTPEPTGGVVWNASRGALSLRVSVSGRSAHVGEHYRGANAFSAMLRICDRLRVLGQRVEGRRTRFAITPEEARRSVLLVGGTVSGGTNFNAVPDRCIFTVDRRFNPEESLEQEAEELLGVIHAEAAPGISVAVETLQRAGSSASDPGSAPAVALLSNAESLLGERPRVELCPGLLETRFYAGLGIPAFAYGPGLLSVAHGPEEDVELERVRQFALIYALTASDLLR